MLQLAATAHPADIALNQLLGDSLRDAGQLDEAVAAYRAAIAADPTAGNYNKLGIEQLKMKRIDDAIATLNEAAAADANAAEPHFHLGEAYEQQGDNARALEEYRAYLAIAGQNDPYYPQATAAAARLQQ